MNFLIHLNFKRSIFFLFSCVLTFQGFAKEFISGQKEYMSGDFARAETLLSSSLKVIENKDTKAEVYKLLAISQYMLGKRLDSESNFKSAINLDSQIMIKNDEVLDVGVINFFKNIKSKYKVAKHEVDPKKTITKINDKPTYLYIKSKYKLSFILDKKLKIKSGIKIPIEPGNHEIFANISGYKNIYKKLLLKEGIVNVVSVILEKENLSSKDESNDTSREEKTIKSNKKGNELKTSPSKKSLTQNNNTNFKTFPSRKDESSWLIKSSPFGVYHFLEGRYIWGSVFASSQLTGLMLGVFKWLEAGNLADKHSEEISRLDSQGVDITQKKQDYQAEVDSIYQLAYIGYGVFALAWMGSLLEIILNPSEFHTEKQSLNSTKSYNILSHNFKSSVVFPELDKSYESSLGFGILPSYDANKRINEFDLFLNINFSL